MARSCRSPVVAGAGRPAGARVRTVSVLTIDDHASFREAARAVVAATEGFAVVAEATTGEDGVAMARRLKPDVVLLDVVLPDIDGYEVARRLSGEQPGSVIVLVSAAEELLRGDLPTTCGAVAFVRKEDLRPTLLRDLWRLHGTHA
jgi:two-component system, NarL family, invasion response regulator UvrY